MKVSSRIEVSRFVHGKVRTKDEHMYPSVCLCEYVGMWIGT